MLVLLRTLSRFVPRDHAYDVSATFMNDVYAATIPNPTRLFVASHDLSPVLSDSELLPTLRDIILPVSLAGTIRSLERRTTSRETV